MIQAIPKTVTFDEFIDWYPQQSTVRYELHNGVIVEMPKPTGTHSRLAGWVSGKLFLEIDRRQSPYFIPKECIVKSSDANSGYEPDVIVLSEAEIEDEPRWNKESIITQGSSIPLIIEVVSTNWHDDYALKLEEYELMGIAEYWILDYLGIGGRRYIGNPKQPTFSICCLQNGEYEISRFQGSDRIQSLIFPELDWTVDRVFQKARSL